MTADEKQKLFNLLKTADAWNLGYTRDEFAVTPQFSDDEVINTATAEPVSVPSELTKPAEPVSVSSEPINTQELPAEEAVKSGMTMEQLKTKIERCTRCSLARTRNNVVPGMGVEHPDVLVIGEGPGEDEDMQGLPFVGKAGVLLDKMLDAIQLNRQTNCYIANIVKCRPPQNRNPFPDEQSACFGFLQSQIHILKPKMILCMGKIAIEKLMDQRVAIMTEHGTFYDYHGIPVMVTYHPSALLREPELKRGAWNDLKAFKAKLDTLK